MKANEREYGKSQAICNRESWVKTIIILLFSSVIVWKFVTTPLNLVDFKFSDLLSLILAIFAVALSVAFYFKANDTANKFYDNTYKFTGDVHILLGRFEERLRHLDEGYIGLRDRFDGKQFDTKTVERKVEQDEEEVKKKEKERILLIKKVIGKELKHDEMEEWFSKFNAIEKEMTNTKIELTFLKRRLSHADFKKIDFALRKFMHRLIDEMGRNFVLAESPAQIKERFNTMREYLPTPFMDDIINLDFADSTGYLTDKGALFLKNLAESASEH